MNRLFPLALLLFMASAAATSIDAPEKVPANVSWSFSVYLNPTDSFSSVDVLVQGDKVLTVYSNGSVVVDPFNGKFVVKAFTFDADSNSTSGLVLYVSYLGLPQGTYAVEADGVSDTVQVFSALDESVKQDLESQLSQAVSDREAFEQRIKNLETDNTAFWQSIQENTAAIDSLSGVQEEVSSLRSDLDDSASKVGSLNERIVGVEGEVVAIIQENNERLQQQQLAEANNPVIGLASLGGGFALPLGLILLGVVLVLAVNYARKSFSSASVYKKDLPSQETLKEVVEESPDVGGKWAFAPPKKEEPVKKVKLF